MAQYTISDNKFRGSPYDNECELHMCGYRLDRGHGKDRRSRSALNSAKVI